jgi:hypothetical protein
VVSNLANVTILARAWSDLRFVRLARFLELGHAADALARCARLWAYQTSLFTPAAPTYAVDADTIEDAIGVQGAAGALVRADLAEEVPGPDGRTIYRVKGTAGMIEWLANRRRSAPLGAAARKRGNTTHPPGMPAGQPDGSTPVNGIAHHNPHPGGMPPGQPAGAPHGQPPGLPSDLPEDPDQNINTRARERHPAAGGIARRVWDYGARIRSELVAANLQVPPWSVMVGTEHAGWIALLDRVCERLVGSTSSEAERVCRNRVDVAAAKARLDGEGNWFASTSMFTAKSFAMFADLDPAQFARRAPRKRGAGELIGAADPRSDHPDSESLIPCSELFR